jgi:hypothetical protein
LIENNIKCRSKMSRSAARGRLLRKPSWREAGEEETSVDFEEKAAPYK